MALRPTESGHGLKAEDERWGNRFSAIMLGVCLLLVVVLLVLASQT